MSTDRLPVAEPADVLPTVGEPEATGLTARNTVRNTPQEAAR
ncbi:hypothetical protein ACH46L_23760 [Streptomyces althioticus]